MAGGGGGDSKLRLPARARRVAKPGDPLFRSAYALMLSTGTSSVVGFLYWIIAARVYPPAALGEASAAIASIMLLSSVAQLNLFYALARFVPRAGKSAGRLIAHSYVANGIASAVVGGLFVVVAPRASENLAYLERGAAYSALFVCSVAFWGMFSLQDGVLTALRRPMLVPLENVIYGIIKIALLVLFASVWVRDGIFASWNLPVAVIVVALNTYVFRRILPDRDVPPTPSPKPFEGLWRFATIDYVGSLFLQAYSNALPLIIVATLGPEANANFYIADIIVTVLDLACVNLATSLLVEASHEESRLEEYADRMLRRSSLALSAIVVILVLGAPYALAVFGPDYSHGATTTLRLLAISTLPRLLHILYTSAMRVQRQVGRVLVLEAATAILVVGLSLILMPKVGVAGVAAAWLIAHVVVGVALLPWLHSVMTWRRRLPASTLESHSD